MTAAEAINRLHEKKRHAPNWTNTKGIYADLSGYPDVEYYVKCPKCGQVHGSYKTMREAHAKRLCDLCDIEAINKLKKQVKEVDSPKNRDKPGKSTSKLFNEADEMLPPPPAPEDEFNPREYLMSVPSYDEGNWIGEAIHFLGIQEATTFSLSRRDRDAIDDPDSHLKVDVEGEDGTEWTIYQSEDEAITAARADVERRLQEEPGSFNADWLRGHINWERVKNYFRESARDIEWLNDMDEQEQVDYLVRDGTLNEEDFYNEEGEFVPNEDLLDAGKDAFMDKQEENFDPEDFLAEMFGKDEVMAKGVEFGGIDYDGAAQEAVATYGWVHFMNSYDGNFSHLENGAVAFRTN